jgi:cytoskeletal protein CcmA (bactofilin family)
MANQEPADTLIGASVELKGSLKNQGSIVINGTVIGDVTSGATVVISETGRVQGPIIAKRIEVAGTVIGSLRGEQLIDLLPKSIVQGDLAGGQLSIRQGATFVGKCEMPLPDGHSHPKSAPKPE